ncbi:hypothetical protein J1614_001589 [Plenodomus biglobosus]|nr:hypothetical protein J1614_001589 [Plenodomus biglobosus]
MAGGYTPEHGSIVAVQGIVESWPAIYFLGGKLERVNNLLQQVTSAPSHGPVDECSFVVCTSKTDKTQERLYPDALITHQEMAYITEAPDNMNMEPKNKSVLRNPDGSKIVFQFMASIHRNRSS